MRLRFQCEVCGTVWFSRKAVEMCESFGDAYAPKYAVGDKVYTPEDKEFTQVTIKEIYIGPNMVWPHVGRDETGEQSFDEGVALWRQYNMEPWHEVKYRVEPYLWHDDSSWDVIAEDMITDSKGSFLHPPTHTTAEGGK